MEIQLFGDVRLRVAGRDLDVGTPRQQSVLAALVIEAGRPVSVDSLIDRVWGDAAPVEARNVLYSHVSRIRHLLTKATGLAGESLAQLERRHAGYLLRVDPDLVDLLRFRRLVAEGRDRQRGEAARVDALGRALRLWQGTPLAALRGEWVGQVQASWYRLRLDAMVQWGQLELRRGEAESVIAALYDVAAENPLVEPLEAVLMQALWAAGREAEALDRFATLRRRLAEELGADPSAELRALHQAILRGAAAPAVRPQPAPPDRDARPPSLVVVPAQLPRGTYGFIGRDLQLHRMDAGLAVTDEPAAATTVFVVSGTAGVGKTALAVHWAHRVRHRFADGQLYVNLRGFDDTGTPVLPADAVRGFLDALGVPPERIPVGIEAQVGLYRSHLADRRVLVVLDNARDADQVRPLLPGASGCVVVVTSRNRLTGLIAEGAIPLSLDLLTPTEARELLSRRVGSDRVAAEPGAVDEIVTMCARLPLAVAIVAARAAANPGFALRALANQLRDSSGRLDEFADADQVTDVRAVFSWSYHQLTPQTARLFRLLGLQPGPDIGAFGAASLAGIPVRHARSLLADLARANLVAEHVPGRYSLHDLLRAYAGELAAGHEDDTERHEAVRRLLSHYVHTAHRADALLNPHRDHRVQLDAPPAGVVTEQMADLAQALAWFTVEHPALVTCVCRLDRFDAEVWRLAWALVRFFDYRARWREKVAVLGAALQAARRLGDPVKQAFAHRLIGCAHIRLGQYVDAEAHLHEALDLYRAAADPLGEAHGHRHYSWLLERQGRHREALGHAERSLALSRDGGDRAAEGRSLNAIGWFHALLGDLPAALRHCRQALHLQQQLGDRFGQAETWDSLGYVHHRLGQYGKAVESYRTAADLYHEFDDHFNEADTLASLGDAHLAAGQPEPARAAWQDALIVLDRIGHPGTDQLRAKLAAVTTAPPAAA
jgi:DNA-binding SARP family transcriptional activator/tetratricopeptide (TPR) repeat protein